jgi:hypothetical protein
MMVLHSGASLEDKIDFLFQTFDTDRTKTITPDEFCRLMFIISKALEQIGGVRSKLGKQMWMRGDRRGKCGVCCVLCAVLLCCCAAVRCVLCAVCVCAVLLSIRCDALC